MEKYMAKYRQGRINDEVQKEMAMIVREIKDPRVSGKLICITAAEVTPDLKFGKIYYSVMGGDKKEVAKGLKAASGFIRRELANSLNLRITPELTFVADDSVAYGAHIASILNTLDIKPEEEDEDEEEI